MDRGWMLTICIVVIAVSLTSVFFLLVDITHYFHVIEIMFVKIHTAFRIILGLLLLLFFAVLILVRNL